MRWLAVLPAAITVVLMAGAVLLSLDGPPARNAFDVPLYSATSAIAAAAVGALLLWRSPTHVVGWVLAASALAGATEKAADQYATLATLRVSDLPGGDWAAWLGSWIWFVEIVLYAVVLPIVFPTGRPLTARWRIGLVTGGLALIGLIAATALRAGQLEAVPNVTNPVGALGSDQIGAVRTISFLLLLFSVGSAIAAMAVRYRRSSGVERQQMKWLGSALVVFGLSFLVSAGLYLTGGPVDLPAVIVLLSATLVPIAVGVAILRYRLYDIDLLINRTLVYVATSAGLLATYVVSVLALGSALRPLTGSGELTVAGSTLLVVALFQPLRRRIQGAVDRRFYRARYDAARTLDAFGARLRDEVDLDNVRADLLSVVGETLRPAHASVWLRESGR